MFRFLKSFEGFDTKHFAPVLCTTEVRVQKWLQLSRERPAWAEDFNPLVDWWDSHREATQTTRRTWQLGQLFVKLLAA